MSGRLKIGDVVRYKAPDDGTEQTGTVVGRPSYAPDHDVVVIAPEPPQGGSWRVLNDDWCSRPIGRDVGRARRERPRLRPCATRGFLQRPPPGWSR